VISVHYITFIRAYRYIHADIIQTELGAAHVAILAYTWQCFSARMAWNVV